MTTRGTSTSSITWRRLQKRKKKIPFSATKVKLPSLREKSNLIIHPSIQMKERRIRQDQKDHLFQAINRMGQPRRRSIARSLLSGRPQKTGKRPNDFQAVRMIPPINVVKETTYFWWKRNPQKWVRKRRKLRNKVLNLQNLNKKSVIFPKLRKWNLFKKCNSMFKKRSSNSRLVKFSNSNNRKSRKF